MAFSDRESELSALNEVARRPWLLTMAAFWCFLQVVSAEEIALDVTQWRGAAPTTEVEKDGLSVAKWARMDRDRYLEAKTFPEDWKRFRTLRFWVYCPEKRDSIITLIITSDNPETPGGDYFGVAFHTAWVGWREVKIALDELRGSRKPVGWHKIDRIFFSSNWAHRLEEGTLIYIAGFRLTDQPLPNQALTPANEVLRNGSFEQDRNFDGRPDSWGGGGYGTKARPEPDHAVAFDGGVSARISSPAVTERGGCSHSPKARRGSTSFSSSICGPTDSEDEDEQEDEDDSPPRDGDPPCPNPR